MHLLHNTFCDLIQDKTVKKIMETSNLFSSLKSVDLSDCVIDFDGKKVDQIKKKK